MPLILYSAYKFIKIITKEYILIQKTPSNKTPPSASPQKNAPKTPKKNIPTESDVIDYVQSQNGFVLRRDIARAFQIKGPDRRRLKEVLMGLVAQHTLERRGKSYRVKGEADLTVIEVLGLNDDGDFMGCVIEEDHHNFEESARLILSTPALEKQLHNGDRWAAKLQITDDHLEATLLRRLNIEPKGILGLLQKDENRILLAPLERKDRNLYLVDPASCDRFSAKVGDLVEASLEKATKERFKVAHILKVLSPQADLVHHLSHMAIHRYDLKTEFSKEALAQRPLKVERICAISPWSPSMISLLGITTMRFMQNQTKTPTTKGGGVS